MWCPSSTHSRIWKSRNEFVFTGKVANSEPVIQKMWHGVGTCITIEWHTFMSDVTKHKMSLMDAKEQLAFLFTVEGVDMWNLDEIKSKSLHTPPPPLTHREAMGQFSKRSRQPMGLLAHHGFTGWELTHLPRGFLLILSFIFLWFCVCRPGCAWWLLVPSVGEKHYPSY